MKLVIESGATKSIWILLNSTQVIMRINAKGFNISNESTHALEIPKPLNEKSASIEEIHYYGAGVISHNHTENLKEHFEKNLGVNGNKCFINNDLLAIANAGLGDNAGYLAILGTGSSAAYYDGNNVIESSPNLGYILTDEGSGHAIGKRIIKSYYYGQMPEEINQKFKDTYDLSRSEFLASLSNSTTQAAYLASFVPFLDLLDKNDPWKTKLLIDQFSSFFEYKMKPLLKNGRPKKLFIVGSVAYIFKDILTTVCAANGIKDTFVIRNPTEGLIEYHQK